MGRSIINIEGKRFGRLLVIRRIQCGGGSGIHARWLCACWCGNVVEVDGSRLRTSVTKSCGCYGREQVVKAHITHGKSHSPIFSVWNGMKDRCQNINSKNYSRYGGRGIKICERWKTFQNFFADMGEKPVGMSINRIDNDGNYEPKNCEWATPKEQALNRTSKLVITLRGERKTVSEWSVELGINKQTIYTRLFKGWEIEDVLSPLRQQHKRSV